jgi:HSP20 family molecular chaperone IbpA
MQNRIRAGSVSRRLSERARAADSGRADAMPADDASWGQGAGLLFSRLRQAVEQIAQAARDAAPPDGEATPGEAAGTGFTLGGRQAKMVFGYTVTTGLDGVRAEPFGDLPQAAARPGSKRPAPPAPASRAPIVDVFEEPGHICVIAELPGVAAEEVRCDVTGLSLRIATQGDHRYEKIITLPGPVDAASLVQGCRNGILEIRLARAVP